MLYSINLHSFLHETCSWRERDILVVFLGCAAILAAAQPLKIVFVVVLLCCCSQINFYNLSFDVET